ncbi:metallophosphoesterase [bacterium]|nr:metallophosphoesterase [bacterium]
MVSAKGLGKVNKRKKAIIIFLVIILILAAFFVWQNNDITITKIDISNKKVPTDFVGFRILQISDLHNKMFGNNQKILVSKIKKLSPDIIFITGDLIDSHRTKVEPAIILLEQLVEIAPVYYVNGNHEASALSAYQELKIEMEELGVKILENFKEILYKNESYIEIIGINDPAFSGSKESYSDEAVTNEELGKLVDAEGNFTILLAHRPELLAIYEQNKVDLVFSGHAHGGQIRLPFLGGLIAPNQGIFPKLTQGIHNKNDTSMVISRGLGNSIIPFRVFNRPELILATLSN